jgi:hypothetical protein
LDFELYLTRYIDAFDPGREGAGSDQLHHLIDAPLELIRENERINPQRGKAMSGAGPSSLCEKCE